MSKRTSYVSVFFICACHAAHFLDVYSNNAGPLGNVSACGIERKTSVSVETYQLRFRVFICACHPAHFLSVCSNNAGALGNACG